MKRGVEEEKKKEERKKEEKPVDQLRLSKIVANLNKI